MSAVKFFLRPVLFSVLYLLLGTGFVVAAEIDDSSLFAEAFRAYQKSDYLRAIEKIRTLQQLFPDSPLQDITLLLLARSALRSGDNELAALSVNRFTNDFPANPLKSALESELNSLASRKLRGEKLPADRQLFAAAQNVYNRNRVSEQAANPQTGQDHTAARPLVARLDDDADRRHQDPDARERSAPLEQVQQAAVKYARESIRTAISIISSDQVVEAGKTGMVQFEVANRGTSNEDFIVQVLAPAEYQAVLVQNDTARDTSRKITISTAKPYRGTVAYRMPAEKVDGHKDTLVLRAASVRFGDIAETREARISAASPLVRVVARPLHQTLRPGEKTRFRVTLLNAGSLPARRLTVNIRLPAQTLFLDASGADYRQDTPGVISFTVDSLETGRLVEFGIDVRVREDCNTGQELRSRIEVVNAQQKTRETYTSAAVVVE